MHMMNREIIPGRNKRVNSTVFFVDCDRYWHLD